MNVVIGAVLLLIALFCGAFAAFAFRAFWSFAKKGPSAARDAFEHGESVRTWWNASPVVNLTNDPRDVERFAMGGRHDDEVGDEFDEERAAYAR